MYFYLHHSCKTNDLFIISNFKIFKFNLRFFNSVEHRFLTFYKYLKSIWNIWWSIIVLIEDQTSIWTRLVEAYLICVQILVDLSSDSSKDQIKIYLQKIPPTEDTPTHTCYNNDLTFIILIIYVTLCISYINYIFQHVHNKSYLFIQHHIHQDTIEHMYKLNNIHSYVAWVSSTS